MPQKTVKVDAKLSNGFLIESDIRGHRVFMDQPEGPGATDKGPTPLEYLLVSLAGCIATMGRIVAAQKKIELRGLSVAVEGEINTDGLLGKDTSDRIGFTGLHLKVSIDADMTAQEKLSFAQLLEKRCPVSENLTGTTPLTLEVL